jgi:hypothetical protein
MKTKGSDPALFIKLSPYTVQKISVVEQAAIKLTFIFANLHRNGGR